MGSRADVLDAFKSADDSVPGKMLRWRLYGAGLENLGRDGAPEEVDVPEFGPHELLVRQDACGLCFSDTKVIGLGPDHPRMLGRDMASNPVTLGHEVACTVVGVGRELESRFHKGDRFVVQADVFYQGKSMAYGYVIPGGLSEYSVIPKAVIDGDEGCYLLPIRPETGYVEAALTEPWACVVSAYAQQHRDGVQPDGNLLAIIGAGATSEEAVWLELFSSGRMPAEIVLFGSHGSATASLAAVARRLHIEVETLPASGAITLAADMLFDDILCIGNVAADTLEEAASHLADNGVLAFVAHPGISRRLALDIGRIHYNRRHFVGTRSSNLAAAYLESRSAELTPGGLAWFIGAGGPMGQMHVQRAVQLQRPPRRIVATDVDKVRLESVLERFGHMARSHNIELIAINPSELSEITFSERIRSLCGDLGFEDIVSLVPVASVIEHASTYLAEGGWFNIFAGVARGTMAALDVNPVASSGVRYLGSSGSSLADMRETLSRVERHDLSTNASLAAIGGLEAAAEGLRAVKEGWFPGKTLIFPHIHGLPITSLPELRDRLPTVYAKLQDGAFWTQEAEEELLRLKLRPPSTNQLEPPQTIRPGKEHP